MPSLGWWEKIIYVISLAFWQAYFDVREASKSAKEEVPNEKDIIRRNNFRNAVARLRAKENSDSRPDDTSSGGAGI